ncbi:hypothetical protein VagYM19_12360 [Vibrio alginolyticus]|nr:hypothetical protein Vag1382_12350 [Vibrio alginolyticus]BCB46709.1 hypothetical protein VagVIO5_12350 [Vibrio alginolyticus]BCB51310.1 hypothetical protein VagYM19_12360 [Vibrio alginolyticus]BCB55913.1 hypothetical protein VagYM4_12360 [Vibrio alginolyticus]
MTLIHPINQLKIEKKSRCIKTRWLIPSHASQTYKRWHISARTATGSQGCGIHVA